MFVRPGLFSIRHKRMKVLIDGQTLLTPDINRGIGTYFKNTIETILENDFTNDFYMNVSSGSHVNFLSPWAKEKLCFISNPTYDIHSSPHHSRDYFTKQYSDAVVTHIEKRGIDLYWSPNALMNDVFVPTRVNGGGCQFAVTIFDLIVAVMEKHYLKQWSPAAIATYKNKLETLARDFDLYIHISRHTQSDFIGMLPVRGKMHIVTPLAASGFFHPYPFPRRANEESYVLFPGGFDPRKNMKRAVEAFANLQLRYGTEHTVRATQLSIVCGFDEASRRDMMNHIESSGLRGKITLTGFVDETTLLRLYQNARCLFFPSLYEGFGLPILEGLACGLPVASSNTSSLPEVGGDLAIYFDPYNIEEMADGLHQALQAPIDYESRRKRYEYSRRFSWQDTALATLKAFADCAKN